MTEWAVGLDYIFYDLMMTAILACFKVEMDLGAYHVAYMLNYGPAITIPAVCFYKMKNKKMDAFSSFFFKYKYEFL